MNETTKSATGLFHCLRSRDARALIRHLVEAYGFEEVVVYGDGDRVDHAELAWPHGGGVMLGSVRGGADDSWALQTGTAGAYLVVADAAALDALFDRARANGAIITAEPFDTDYGSRDFAARDPEGNLWSFGTYPGAYAASASSVGATTP